MGNARLGRQRPAVQERLTRPQRLVRQLSDLDSGRLRRLIRSGDLAPCFDADDDERAVECPICFYFYPTLNQSKCCGKGICTECFLQLMPSKASKAVHCPFCKTATYAVEYCSARTSSEKKLQQEVSFLARYSDQKHHRTTLHFPTSLVLSFLQEEQNTNEAKTRMRSKTHKTIEIQS
ncbi:E3 ubiquitin-protein ligase GW2-like [Lolium rigidum]|uniref:E3 ubiquitin-protein ligase GW2-like n=1 Tax=Lolium rigidum TaxID=89674 RepID=UPI001F5D3904|nr:E3 ubiquitin-protein ligase GW2-like [Lolium rigidum]